MLFHSAATVGGESATCPLTHTGYTSLHLVNVILTDRGESNAIHPSKKAEIIMRSWTLAQAWSLLQQDLSSWSPSDRVNIFLLYHSGFLLSYIIPLTVNHKVPDDGGQTLKQVTSARQKNKMKQSDRKIEPDVLLAKPSGKSECLLSGAHCFPW